jgi:hypothetical protein
MPKAENFAAFILTHGRPDRVHTFESLRKHGYTGRIVIVIDNEDRAADEYRKRFGALVREFDKPAVARRIDEGDNFEDRRAIIYARNACFEIAADLGVEYFVQLDDDYVDFRHKRDERGEYIHKRDIADLDAVFDALLDYYKATPALSIAMAQGGDFPGGAECGTRYKVKRKCMNSFICSTLRPFEFVGRINEDVNTYTSRAARGDLFLTVQDVALQQKQTQKNAGGMTELYRDSGTYVKSFYSVMYHPSATRVGIDPAVGRIHHRLNWRRTAPCILSETFRKAR